jgi:adenosine deaminase CECR1
MRVKSRRANSLMEDLIGSASLFRFYVYKLLETLVHDNILYAELRFKLFEKYIRGDDGRRKLFSNDLLQIILEEVDRFQLRLTGEGRRDLCPFGLKFICCAPRSISKISLQSAIQGCISLKLTFPDLICGMSYCSYFA